VDLGAVVQLILVYPSVIYSFLPSLLRFQVYKGTYIVIIRLAHLQAAGPFGLALAIAVASYALECVATAPLATGTPDIPLHSV
jgi:hypothetical protein